MFYILRKIFKLIRWGVAIAIMVLVAAYVFAGCTHHTCPAYRGSVVEACQPAQERTTQIS